MVKARSWKRNKPSLPSPYLNHVTAAVRRRKEEEAKRHAEEEELKRAGTEVHAEDVAPKGTFIQRHAVMGANYEREREADGGVPLSMLDGCLCGAAELSEDAVRAHIAEVEQKLDALNDEKHKVILRLKQLLKDEETRKQAERAREEREAAERARQAAVAAATAAAAAAAGQRKTLFSPAPGSSLPPPPMHSGIIASPGSAVPRPMPFVNREPPQPPHGRVKPLHLSSPGLLNSPRPPSAAVPPPGMYSPPSTAPPPVPVGAPSGPLHYGAPPSPYVQFPVGMTSLLLRSVCSF